MKFPNKIIENLAKKYIKEIIHPDQVLFNQGI